MRDSFAMPRPAVFLRAALVAVVAGGVLAMPASATKRNGFDVGPGKQGGGDYPALVGNYPGQANDQAELTPGDCETVTFCDTIPFNVEAPKGLKEDENFYVTVEVSWPDANRANDIDVWVWDNGQLKGGSDTRVGRATTSRNPERVVFQQPELGEYQLQVMNMSGVNQGYKVKATLTIGKFETPVDAVAAPPRPTTTTTAAANESPTETTTPDTTPTTLAPVPVAADRDFDFGESDFDEEIAAPRGPAIEDLPENLRRTSADKDVSPAAVVLWFVVAPVALAGAAGAFVFRRRRSLLIGS